MISLPDFVAIKIRGFIDDINIEVYLCISCAVIWQNAILRITVNLFILLYLWGVVL